MSTAQPSDSGGRPILASLADLRRGGRPVLLAASVLGLAGVALPWTGSFTTYTRNAGYGYDVSGSGTSGLSTGLGGAALLAALAVGVVAILNPRHPLLRVGRLVVALLAPVMIGLAVAGIQRDSNDTRWVDTVHGYHSAPAGPYVYCGAAVLTAIGAVWLLTSGRRPPAAGGPSPVGVAAPPPPPPSQPPVPAESRPGPAASAAPPSATPVTAAGAPSAAVPPPQPQWDAARSTWVVWDPAIQCWLAWEPARGQWTIIQPDDRARS